MESIEAEMIAEQFRHAVDLTNGNWTGSR